MSASKGSTLPSRSSSVNRSAGIKKNIIRHDLALTNDSFYKKPKSQSYVGIVNPFGQFCGSRAECMGVVTWMDGSATDSLADPYFLVGKSTNLFIYAL